MGLLKARGEKGILNKYFTRKILTQSFTENASLKQIQEFSLREDERSAKNSLYLAYSVVTERIEHTSFEFQTFQIKSLAAVCTFSKQF